MAISRGTVPFLVAMMLLTGVCNTLVTKYQVRSACGISRDGLLDATHV
jgi:hypothetical protein